MIVKTTCFGHLEEREVPESQLIHFPAGIIGFEDHDCYALLSEPSLEPFVLLQSLADPWLAFVAIDVEVVRPDYELRLAAADAATLHLEGERPRVLAIVTLRERPEDASVNLLAPLVIDDARRLGRQVVRNDGGYGVAEPLAEVDHAAAAAAEAG